jgi:hypothetical protein
MPLRGVEKMGNGLAPIVANTTLYSLNKLFSVYLSDTKAKYAALNSPDVFPNFLIYTNSSDRRVWRKRTLRHAGWLFTSDLDFTSKTIPYPAREFANWLKWLTWLQTAAGDVNVLVSGVTTHNDETPAQAIMGTLKIALEDKADHAVQFAWSEPTGNDTLTVNVNRTPGKYKIEVISIDAANGNIAAIGDNDEDQHLPPPP